jgi:ribonuclease HII
MTKTNAQRRAEPGALRVGIDENGLGAELGPLVVTAVLARATPEGEALLNGPLPKELERELGDSKGLVSCHDVSLGEAWARALVRKTTRREPEAPSELLRALLREPEASLRADCPKGTEAQCWGEAGEVFEAEGALVTRVEQHLEGLAAGGVTVLAARTEPVCTLRLNRLKSDGIHRFAADLHAMERLVLSLREEAGAPLEVTCGKVGGIAEYGRYFGPLSAYRSVTLEQGAACSTYRFDELGTLRFQRDADATDPLVMLASLVGKYVRELWMRRVARFYPEASGARPPSGYHDAVSRRFVDETAHTRRSRGVPDACFLRERAAPKDRGSRSGSSGAPPQGELF